MPASDARGYYKVLNLSPGASREEVKLAYSFLKLEAKKHGKRPQRGVHEAYACLSDPRQKAAYDRWKRRSSTGPQRRIPILAGAFLVLLLVAAVVSPGFMLPGPAPHPAGTDLVAREGGARLGEVLRRETAHIFPNGKMGEAYLVRLENGSERWFPASDLELHYWQP